MWLYSPVRHPCTLVPVCDTVVVTGEASADGAVLFAKNSDREPSEAQATEIHSSQEHAADALVRCTYVSRPQVRRTHAVLISRPHWMFGAEAGANDRGLVIGNEAVFTKAPMASTGLLGMDLLRLTLERAESARAGVTVLTGLLEEYGQGGAAGHLDKSFRYHNSFLLADPEDAWVVETADRAWVAKRVRGVRAISNGLTVGDDYDLAMTHLHAFARDAGLRPKTRQVDFAETFSDRAITFAANAVGRRDCTERALERVAGSITPRTLMRALRQHGRDDRPRRVASAGRQTVCAHASWWPHRRAGQTTASWVSHVAEAPTHFVTASAAPCTTIFKPVWLDSGLPPLGPTPGNVADESAWWRHERVHRAALGDLSAFLAETAAERDQREHAVVDEALANAHDTEAARADVTRRAFSQSEALDASAQRALGGRARRGFYGRYWRRLDALARL